MIIICYTINTNNYYYDPCKQKLVGGQEKLGIKWIDHPRTLLHKINDVVIFWYNSMTCKAVKCINYKLLCIFFFGGGGGGGGGGSLAKRLLVPTVLLLYQPLCCIHLGSLVPSLFIARGKRVW